MEQIMGFILGLGLDATVIGIIVAIAFLIFFTKAINAIFKLIVIIVLVFVAVRYLNTVDMSVLGDLLKPITEKIDLLGKLLDIVKQLGLK